MNGVTTVRFWLLPEITRLEEPAFARRWQRLHWSLRKLGLYSAFVLDARRYHEASCGELSEVFLLDDWRIKKDFDPRQDVVISSFWPHGGVLPDVNLVTWAAMIDDCYSIISQQQLLYQSAPLSCALNHTRPTVALLLCSSEYDQRLLSNTLQDLRCDYGFFPFLLPAPLPAYSLLTKSPKIVVRDGGSQHLFSVLSCAIAKNPAFKGWTMVHDPQVSQQSSLNLASEALVYVNLDSSVNGRHLSLYAIASGAYLVSSFTNCLSPFLSIPAFNDFSSLRPPDDLLGQYEAVAQICMRFRLQPAQVHHQSQLLSRLVYRYFSKRYSLEVLKISLSRLLHRLASPGASCQSSFYVR